MGGPDSSKLARALCRAFAQETDRGVAVLGICFLDDILGEMLTSALMRSGHQSSHQHVSELTRRQIRDFSRKIRFAKGLGLIADDEEKQLDHLREIRNRLAHYWSDMTFDAPKTAELCRKLAPVPTPASPEANDIRLIKLALGKSDFRARFQYAVFHLAISIASRAERDSDSPQPGQHRSAS